MLQINWTLDYLFSGCMWHLKIGVKYARMLDNSFTIHADDDHGDNDNNNTLSMPPNKLPLFIKATALPQSYLKLKTPTI